MISKDNMGMGMCMPEAWGPQAQGMMAFKSGKSQIHMLQVLCNNFIAMVTTPVG